MNDWMWLVKDWQHRKFFYLTNLFITSLIATQIFTVLGVYSLENFAKTFPIENATSNISIRTYLFEQEIIPQITNLPNINSVALAYHGGTNLSNELRIFVQKKNKEEEIGVKRYNRLFLKGIFSVSVFMVEKFEDLRHLPQVGVDIKVRKSSQNLPRAVMTGPWSAQFGVKVGDRLIFKWFQENRLVHQETILVVAKIPFSNASMIFFEVTPEIKEKIFDNQLVIYLMGINSTNPTQTKEEIKRIVAELSDKNNRDIFFEMMTREELLERELKTLSVLHPPEYQARGMRIIMSIFALALIFLYRWLHYKRIKLYSLLYTLGISRKKLAFQLFVESLLIAVVITTIGSLLAKYYIENIFSWWLVVDYKALIKYGFYALLTVLGVILFYLSVVLFLTLRLKPLVGRLRKMGG